LIDAPGKEAVRGRADCLQPRRGETKGARGRVTSTITRRVPALTASTDRYRHTPETASRTEGPHPPRTRSSAMSIPEDTGAHVHKSSARSGRFHPDTAWR